MMGLSMVSIEAIASAKAFKHKVDNEILEGLARGLIITLGIYLIMKLIHLFSGPGLGVVFNGSMESNMYLLEVIVGILVPLVIFLSSGKKASGSFSTIVIGHLLVIGGIIINRLNINLFSLYRDATQSGGCYFPSAGEILVSLALVALGIVVFKTAAKYLDLFPESEPS